MSEKTVYDLSVEDDRRQFFGLDVSHLKDQEFQLRNLHDVTLFSERLANYVAEEFGPEFHWIDLPHWYEYCNRTQMDGRLFIAILDLKITLAFLLIDSRKSGPDFDSLNGQDTSDILSDPALFRKKMTALHESIDLAIRYRAFFDKLMGILILYFNPGEYEHFNRSGSHKKWFSQHMVGHLGKDNMDLLITDISSLDDNYRTAEVHQNGKMRKWVLSSQGCYLDNLFDFMAYTNKVLEYARWLDGLLEGV